MDEIVLKAKKIANECAEKLGLEIIDIEYVKERNDKILRVIAEKDGGLTIDDSCDLNRAISKELDRVDLIQEEYFLEVSSVGLERELKNSKDLECSIGDYVCIGLYEKLDGKKEYYGDLLEFSDDSISIRANVKGIEKVVSFDKKKISKIRLAVKF